MTRRRLDAELVRRRLYSSRNAAKAAIAAGEIEVAGRVATKPATQVDDSVSIRITEPPSRYVSRGGFKLEAALEQWPIDVHGKRALDAGASSGGFTDCLLQHGAAAVAALDVGYGQLDWKLREDPRVAVYERHNVRLMSPEAVGGPFDIVVADLSFISLRTVAPALAAAGTVEADWVLLVKPQFEAGKDRVGKGGIVRDGATRAEALRRVITAFEQLGLGARGVGDSPISGTKGNREFLLWLRRGPGKVAPADLANLKGVAGSDDA